MSSFFVIIVKINRWIVDLNRIHFKMKKFVENFFNLFKNEKIHSILNNNERI